LDKKLIIGITAESSVNLLLGQLNYFRSLGYKTYLLAPYSERSAKFCRDEGCEHLVIEIEREISIWKDLRTLLQILRIFRNVKPDIVNLGTPKVSLLGMIAAFILRVPKRIYTCRGFRFEHELHAKKQILIFMEKVTSFLSHKVICISKSVEDLGQQFKIFDQKKSLVILKGSSNGINLSLFDPSKINLNKRNELVQAHSLAGKFVFGFLGRIVDRKGIQELIEVFCALYENSESLRLLIVGPFEMEQITDKTLLDKANNHPGIIYIGRVMHHEVPPYFSLMDVFVLPAWWEGFGNVLIQAAAIGIPVISTNATGTKDAVQDGYNGILVPIKDEDKLREAMVRLYKEESTRIEMGKNGINWAKNFDQKLIWEGMENVYKEPHV
jgi:glycosyltransferase involved in cell wall biosynthesis